jgi:hypothetical protein
LNVFAASPWQDLSSAPSARTTPSRFGANRIQLLNLLKSVLRDFHPFAVETLHFSFLILQFPVPHFGLWTLGPWTAEALQPLEFSL